MCVSVRRAYVYVCDREREKEREREREREREYLRVEEKRLETTLTMFMFFNLDINRDRQSDEGTASSWLNNPARLEGLIQNGNFNEKLKFGNFSRENQTSWIIQIDRSDTE